MGKCKQISKYQYKTGTICSCNGFYMAISNQKTRIPFNRKMFFLCFFNATTNFHVYWLNRVRELHKHKNQIWTVVTRENKSECVCVFVSKGEREKLLYDLFWSLIIEF